MSKLSFNQLSGMNCHYAHHTFDYFLDSLAYNGLRNVEIWGASPHLHVDDASPKVIEEARRAVESRGMELICYTPETVVYPINIAAIEDYIRERSLRFMLRAVEVTAELGCKQMLLTPGWGYLDGSSGEAMKYSLDSIAKITRHGEENGVILALEHLSPISSNLVNTASQLKAVLETIQSPNLKAMLDTCQVGLVNEHVRDYLDLIGEDLIHVHIVDGTPGGHLAFGDGILPLEDYVKTLGEYGYSHYLSMEIADRRYFAHPEEADMQSIEAFRRWLS